MNDPVPSLPAVLTFAATDPTSGAGLQADLLALASMGCYPLSVVTALTVQDTAGVDAFLAIDPDWVADQARCILEDMPVAAFKMGMLGSTEIVTVVAEVVSDYPDVPLVLDPVFASGRGDEFAGEEMISAIRELLVPQSTVVTPNIAELRRLAGEDDNDDVGIAECAQVLLDSGCEYVLVTGTHDSTADVVNTLYHRGGVLRADTWQRLPGSYHGSGCTLASALAANLARGLDIGDAVYEAQDYTWQALAHAFRPGMGQYLPDRLFWAREGAGDSDEK
jgi:hydroxymethylpyrimidine/phosphomethylpyrimidine kinase